MGISPSTPQPRRRKAQAKQRRGQQAAISKFVIIHCSFPVPDQWVFCAIGRGLDIRFNRLHDAGQADMLLRTRRRTGFAVHSPAL